MFENSGTGARVMFENGEEEDMGAEEINRYIAANQRDVIEKAVDTTPLCGGLVRVDFHLERYGIDSTALLVNVDPSALTVMRTDVAYFMRVREVSNGRESLGTEIWACNPGALKTEKAESWNVARVRLKGGEGQDEPTTETVYRTEEGEDGEAVALTLGDAGLDPDNLYRFYNKTAERPLVLGDAMWSLVMLVASSDIATQRHEKKARDRLPRQDVRKLRRQNDPTSKVATAMTDPRLFTVGGELDVTGDGEKRRGKDITTAVSFSWDGEGVTIYRPISQYDREVHGAVSSLWADGQRTVTPHQIAKAAGIGNPTKRQVESIMESVDLQRRVLGKIDFTKEARGRALTFEGEPVGAFKLEGYLIAADKTEIVTANGKVVQGYVLLRPPLIYQHAATLGQVVNYPQRLLELGEGRDTEQNIILRRELLRRVYRIKSEHKRKRGDARDGVNRNIRFTADPKHPGRSLFDRAGVNQKNRDARKKAMGYVLGILDGLAERGEIADYKPITETGRGGKRTVGAELIL